MKGEATRRLMGVRGPVPAGGTAAAGAAKAAALAMGIHGRFHGVQNDELVSGYDRSCRLLMLSKSTASYLLLLAIATVEGGGKGASPPPPPVLSTSM